MVMLNRNLSLKGKSISLSYGRKLLAPVLTRISYCKEFVDELKAFPDWLSKAKEKVDVSKHEPEVPFKGPGGKRWFKIRAKDGRVVPAKDPSKQDTPRGGDKPAGGDIPDIPGVRKLNAPVATQQTPVPPQVQKPTTTPTEPPPKKEKLTVDQAESRVREVLGKGELAAEDVDKLRSALFTLTIPELDTVKSRLNIKASGNKVTKIGRIIREALRQAGVESTPESFQSPPEAPESIPDPEVVPESSPAPEVKPEPVSQPEPKKPEAPTITPDNVASIIRKLRDDTGRVTIGKLRSRFPSLTKEQFDKTILDMIKNGQLIHHKKPTGENKPVPQPIEEGPEPALKPALKPVPKEEVKPEPASNTTKTEKTGFPPDDSPRSGRVSQEVSKRMSADFKKRVLPKLDMDEKHALIDYSFEPRAEKPGGYKTINRALRNGTPLGDENKWAVDAMDNAMNEAGELPEPVMAYRGQKFRSKKEGGVFKAQMDAALKSGEGVTFPTYLSTSLNPAVGEEFTDSKFSDSDSIMYEIKAKKGIYLEDISKGDPDEQELLMPRDSNFKVVGKTKIPVRSKTGEIKHYEVYQLEQL